MKQRLSKSTRTHIRRRKAEIRRQFAAAPKRQEEEIQKLYEESGIVNSEANQEEG